MKTTPGKRMARLRGRSWAALAALLLLPACAATRYAARPIDPARSARALEARSLDDVGLQAFMQAHGRKSWPPQAWNPDLLTLAALYFHPDLDLARARRELAEAAIVTAGQRPNPVLSLTPAYNQDAAAGVSPWILGFVLGLPIEAAGKRSLRVSEARHIADAARFRIAHAAWGVRSGVRTTLLDLYAVRERAALLQMQGRVETERAALLAQRVAEGESGRPDLVEAQLREQDVSLAMAQAEQQSAQARARLAQAVGIPLAALRDVALSFELPGAAQSVRPTPSSELAREALTNRSDVLAALSEYAAADSALRIEIARQFPDWTLGPGYQWDQGARKWSLGVALTLPLFNRNQGPIAQAEARRDEAAARLNALQAKILGELDQAFAGYRAARDNLDQARAADDLRVARLRAAQARYRAGYADRMALLDARLAAVTARKVSLDASFAFGKAVSALEDAIERPLAGAPLPAVPEANPRIEQGHVP